MLHGPSPGTGSTTPKRVRHQLPPSRRQCFGAVSLASWRCAQPTALHHWRRSYPPSSPNWANSALLTGTVSIQKPGTCTSWASPFELQSHGADGPGAKARGGDVLLRLGLGQRPDTTFELHGCCHGTSFLQHTADANDHT